MEGGEGKATQSSAKLGFLVFLVLMAVSLFGGIAIAEGPPPSGSGSVDMDDQVLAELVQRLEAGETLTDEEMEGVMRYVSVGSVEESVSEYNVDFGGASGASADGVLCKGQTVTLTHKNILRTTTLWRFTSDTVWCYDGTYIVGEPSVEVEVSACCFWSYRGVINENESGGDGSTQHYDYRQGNFELSSRKSAAPIACNPRFGSGSTGMGPTRTVQ